MNPRAFAVWNRVVSEDAGLESEVASTVQRPGNKDIKTIVEVWILMVPGKRRMVELGVDRLSEVQFGG